jgi:inorganic pyrophosphatase
MKLISDLISSGAITFLKQEYLFLYIYLACFSLVLYFAAEPAGVWFPFTTLAFLIGGTTSICCGYIGMRIAVYTNVRTTKECCVDIHRGFIVAYRGGQVLGFCLVGLAILIL